MPYLQFHKTSSETSNRSKDFILPICGSKYPLCKNYAIKNEKPTRWCHLFHVWRSHDKNQNNFDFAAYNPYIWFVVSLYRDLFNDLHQKLFKNLKHFISSLDDVSGIFASWFHQYKICQRQNEKLFWQKQINWGIYCSKVFCFLLSKVEMTNNCVSMSLIISCTIKYVYSFDIFMIRQTFRVTNEFVIKM